MMNDDANHNDDIVIQTRGLTARYGTRRILHNVDLDVHRGEILAVVGGSGSGKTTLLRHLIVLMRASEGSVRILGQDVGTLEERDLLALRRRIGVLFQNGALFGGMTVLENVGAPLREHTDLSNHLIDELAIIKLGLVGLAPDAGLLYPSELSGGMRKRAALARAIAMDPELLFLDEPTSGLDPLGAEDLDELVLSLKAALEPTIIMVTHDMDSLWRVSDRVILIGDGRVLGQGPMAELARSEVPEVQHFFQGPRGRAAQRQSVR
jgi:phospholipid/cholesterol/gamma-HCH transport system ATP-binding protein